MQVPCVAAAPDPAGCTGPVAAWPWVGHLPPAWLRLDADAGLCGASAPGLCLLQANAEVLQLQGGHLIGARQPARLEQALQQARSGLPVALALARSARLPLTLLCRAWPAAAATPGWLVMLRDPDAEHPAPHHVQALFGLTLTEARVACALALGASTAEVAAQLGVQANTVLAHVKRVLTKTGTRRQAQLVSLLLRSVAMIGTAPDSCRNPQLEVADSPLVCGVQADLGVEAYPSG